MFTRKPYYRETPGIILCIFLLVCLVIGSVRDASANHPSPHCITLEK